MMKNTFRNARLYAFSLMIAVTMFGCGLDEDNPSGGGTSLTGDASTGKSLYASKGCAGCHGADATGGIGPNIQGDLADHITTISGTGLMASVSVTDQEAADIAAYLATIATSETDTGKGDTGGVDGGSDNGAQLYIDNGCASCHGADATGGIGPDITKATVDTISSVVGVAGSMAGISLTSEEEAAIAAWLQSLSGGGDTDTGGDDSGGDGVIPAEDGDPVSGAQLFIDNGCFVCHAADASGGIGPDITEDTIEKITAFVGVVPPMTAISLTPQDRADIVSWLNSL